MNNINLNNEAEIPVYYMRGGTSTGVIIKKTDLPKDKSQIEIILLKIMGIENTDDKNPQITGLGRVVPTSNKVFIVDIIDKSNKIVSSELAQLANNKTSVDWSVNCGNMSSAIPLYLLDSGELDFENGYNKIDIYNINTNKTISAYISVKDSKIHEFCDIPGIIGSYPQIELKLKNPEGSKTGKIFPTGRVTDIINDIEVTCIDVSVPMVIIPASSIGKTGYEDNSELNDKAFLDKIRNIWVEAGRLMKLKNSRGFVMTNDELANSETIPKVCIVSEPIKGGHINTRYFTPQKLHNSLAISGGSCLAASTIINGTVTNKLCKNFDVNIFDKNIIKVNIENPAGILETEIAKDKNNITSVKYKRSSQILMKGFVKLYNLNNELLGFYTHK